MQHHTFYDTQGEGAWSYISSHRLGSASLLSYLWETWSAQGLRSKELNIHWHKLQMIPEIRLKHVLVIGNRQELLSALNQSRKEWSSSRQICYVAEMPKMPRGAERKNGKQPDIKPLTSEGLFPPASASSNKNPLRSSRRRIYFGVQKTYPVSAIKTILKTYSLELVVALVRFLVPPVLQTDPQPTDGCQVGNQPSAVLLLSVPYLWVKSSKIN